MERDQPRQPSEQEGTMPTKASQEPKPTTELASPETGKLEPAGIGQRPPPFKPLVEGHVWDTKRLRVYQQTVVAPDGVLNQVFSGWLLDGSASRSVVTATIGGRPDGLFVPGRVVAMVWWMVTDEAFRRQGLARELRESIDRNWAPLHGFGVTELGKKFVAGLNKRNAEGLTHDAEDVLSEELRKLWNRG